MFIYSLKPWFGTMVVLNQFSACFISFYASGNLSAKIRSSQATFTITCAYKSNKRTNKWTDTHTYDVHKPFISMFNVSFILYAIQRSIPLFYIDNAIDHFHFENCKRLHFDFMRLVIILVATFCTFMHTYV